MPNCSNCSSSDGKYCLCEDCYLNVFKSLYCDGHCGKKCDPSNRLGSNILSSPFWIYCDECRKSKLKEEFLGDKKKEYNSGDSQQIVLKSNNLEDQDKIISDKIKESLKQNDKINSIVKSSILHDIRHNLENFYDIIVDIDSLKNMTKGWHIKFTEQGRKNYEIMKNEEKLVVGVVGNRNRGKSYVLSKLSNVLLPDGSSIKTEGISIKYPRMDEGKKADYILMDSAGLENALLETDDFKQEQGLDKDKAILNLKEIAGDKTLTEYFLQNFVIQKSNILMVVLGILSYSEQKLLNRIKIENKKKQGNPPLYVIHNLQTYTTKKQVIDYIDETLLKSATFKLKEKKYFKAGVVTDDIKSNTTYFIEEFFNKEDKKLVVNHLILAMDGTEAGDYYNQFVYDFLSEQFTSQPVNEKFPVIDAVKEQCIETSKSIMVDPIESFEDFEEIEDKENKGTIIRLTKKDDKDRILKFKRCLIDELGFSSFFGTNFEPKYSCYKCIVDKKRYVCVKVEIPGNGKFKCKADVKNNFWSISVNGEKILDIKDDIDPSKSINTREQGKFNLNIKLDTTEFQLQQKKPDQNLTKSIEGLRCFYFPLIDDDKSDSDLDSDN